MSVCIRLSSQEGDWFESRDVIIHQVNTLTQKHITMYNLDFQTKVVQSKVLLFKKVEMLMPWSYYNTHTSYY